MSEPIQQELANRFVLFPIRYNSIWKMYKKAVSAFWTPEEVDLSKDYDDWVKLNEKEQHFVKNILAFFAGSDGIVNENLSVRFMNDVSSQEAKCFYGFQIAMENIHCVAGSTWILTKQGYVHIKDVVGKSVEVWNGKEWSQVTPFQTHASSPAYAVTLSNGMKLTCTPNHKWLIENEEDRVMTIDLKPGMQISPYQCAVCDFDEQEIFSKPELHGQIAGNKEPQPDYKPQLFNCRYKEFVPLNYSIDTRVAWIKGFVKNGTITPDQSCLFVSYPTDEVFKQNVQLLFTTLNIFVTVDSNGITIPLNVCTESHPLASILGCGDGQQKAMITVTDVTLLSEQIPMYCFEEPKEHTGVFNGILTGQSEVYSLLLDTYVKDPEEKNTLLNAINTIPCIKKKADWAIKWITDSNSTFAQRLVAFACVEGIFFSGAFCSIFWLKERGILPGLTLSNEFISRDESLHTEFAILLYSHIENTRLTQSQIHDIVMEAVLIEDEFINESIPCNMLGMNKDLMSQYIRFVADRLVIQLGYDPIYNARNPFFFMDRISLTSKTNFFEHTRQSEYALARVGNDSKDNTFDLNADF